MKKRLWLVQIPIILLFTFAYGITWMAETGQINNNFLRASAYPTLRAIAGTFTNAKFRIRGPRPVTEKIIIVEIDDYALSQVGRWPWHRDAIAAVIETILDHGAKVVGIDVVFAEPDPRVPDTLGNLLKSQGLGSVIPDFETDFALRRLLMTPGKGERIVLGWASEGFCQPAYDGTGSDCAITDPEHVARIPADAARFAIPNVIAERGQFDATTTPLITFLGPIMPAPGVFLDVAKHLGAFTSTPDPDGYRRRTPLLTVLNGRIYPSLALETARVGLNDDLEVVLNDQGLVRRIKLKNSDIKVPTNPLGAVEMNFYGRSYSFPYVSAADLLTPLPEDGSPRLVGVRLESLEAPTFLPRPVPQDEPPAAGDGAEKTAETPTQNFHYQLYTADELFKDAIVFLGLSAIGAYDAVAFPFDSLTPGVEGHATIVHNFISGTALRTGAGTWGIVLMMLVMTAGAMLFAVMTSKFESVPALMLFLGSMSAIGIVDQALLFNSRNINVNTSLLYLEITLIFVVTLAMKYVMEEGNRKFIKGAFSKYVAPSIVDSMLKDPTKLTVGGEKKDLTIIFSDIRGFTTFSERMDPKSLSHFLNEYLGQMTEIIFECEGTLDKYIGDAVMAFWGAPGEQPKHAVNACRAAVRMIQRLDELKPVYMEKYGVEVNIGVGVNSGAVSVGNMGSDRIFAYTVIGDHVNLASRLEGLTKYYGAKILTTRFTFDDIEKVGEPLPAHRTLDFVKVKGKKTAVEMIQVFEREYSAEGLQAFEKGRALYLKRQWDDAIAEFKKANQLLRPSADSTDETSMMYMERCETFKQSPPDADWDGSWEMTSK
ncbi:MAG: adenylate/guanylate cyclase domain-containing protein [Bdellovibrionales bacterium]|nr:adenylate/guanylate cyclase domain-containing protein [Bdellovibrionales bacterium]